MCPVRAVSRSGPELDDTSRCPVGVRCERCGLESADLAVTTADLGALGVACLTMCPHCAASGVSPPVTIGTAVRLVMQHAAHVGKTDLDASALLDRYRPFDQLTYRRRPTVR